MSYEDKKADRWVARTVLEKTLEMKLQHTLHSFKQLAEELRANIRGDITRRYYTWMADSIEDKLKTLIEQELPEIRYEEVE